jgi:hypothetical protein
MKTFAFIIAGLLATAAFGAPSVAEPFVAVRPDYKKPQVVPENFFNPFRARTAAENADHRDPALVSNDAVAEAVTTRSVSGLLLGGVRGRVIIGDQVFAIGDPLEFPDDRSSGMAPLIPGTSVVLREVRRESLLLEIDSEGDAPRWLTYSLRSFWQP